MKPVVKMNADTVVKNIERMMDISQNFVPLFVEIVGKESDERDWTLRGSVAKSFARKLSPDDEYDSWKKLSKKYAKEKAKKYPGQPLLVATGALFNSLANKNDFSSVVMDRKVLKFGTNVPYAKYHMTGTDRMPDRRFLGFKSDQMQKIKALIKGYTKAGMKSQKKAEEFLSGGE